MTRLINVLVAISVPDRVQDEIIDADAATMAVQDLKLDEKIQDFVKDCLEGKPHLERAIVSVTTA